MSVREQAGINSPINLMAEQQAETAANVLRPREIFYKEGSLRDLVFVCGDDRNNVAGLQSFGGVLNFVYNMSVLQEALLPGTLSGDFTSQTRAIVPIIKEVGGVKVGVHSDTTAEGSAKMRTDSKGDVGCGYALKRSAISGLIVASREDILSDAQDLAPKLFETSADEEHAEAIIDAHQRLIDEKRGFITPGREVVMEAVNKGAEAFVLPGGHTAKDGIINFVSGTRFDGEEAAAASLPAYNHDAWAVSATWDKLRNVYVYDERQREIANLIDTIGTMRALGVENIVRRG